jgi:hypothetical protein
MIKNATYVFAVLAVGTVAIAWSQQKPGTQPLERVETINPERFGRSNLPELKFNDLSFVHYGDD